jgi:hypothetical protein
MESQSTPQIKSTVSAPTCATSESAQQEPGQLTYESFRVLAHSQLAEWHDLAEEGRKLWASVEKRLSGVGAEALAAFQGLGGSAR